MGPVDDMTIGIFDSGVGGLSVLWELEHLAPGHPIIYLADQAWAPYGERSLDDVRGRAETVTRMLLERGAGLIVVACNSASAAALHTLRRRFPGVPFVGMEPAVKPAAEQTARGVIGVLATNATFQGELYASAVDRHTAGVCVVDQACPGLATAVERGESATVHALLETYLAPLLAAGIDTLVLGCTHYSLLTPAIDAIVGGKVAVIDPAPAVARQTVHMLDGAFGSGARTEYLTTGDADRFARRILELSGGEASVGFVDEPVRESGGVTWG